ncbi:hypothetical protein [Candidatus Blastococcus massiliensis]|uniref:hypothetical protein n=1 Tax=Candidatus Blastococcus massiliensis TaxID=1470358 RepID=UPI0004B47E2C|nr:hypothetical protein [Candidatus Blastococcus massiliensis]
MRRTGVLVLLGALLGALFVVAAAPAQACSCAEATAAQYLESADAVFTGRLVSREAPEERITSADPALHVFAVDTVHKGSVTERQEILSPMSGASCGLEITDDGPVAVFASRTPDPYINGEASAADDQYFAYLCDGTGPLTPELEAELAALGPASAPAPAPAPPEPRAAATPTDDGPDDDGPLAAILVAAAAALLGAGALLVLRRRRG